MVCLFLHLFLLTLIITNFKKKWPFFALWIGFAVTIFCILKKTRSRRSSFMLAAIVTIRFYPFFFVHLFFFLVAFSAVIWYSCIVLGIGLGYSEWKTQMWWVFLWQLGLLAEIAMLLTGIFSKRIGPFVVNFWIKSGILVEIMGSSGQWSGVGPWGLRFKF